MYFNNSIMYCITYTYIALHNCSSQYMFLYIPHQIFFPNQWSNWLENIFYCYLTWRNKILSCSLAYQSSDKGRSVQLILFWNYSHDCSHSYGLSPLCTLIWLTRLPFCENNCMHLSHITTVHSNMPHKVMHLREWFHTLLTLVWFITTVHHNMPQQATVPRKICHTRVTFVWFITTVHPNMHS
jgi:hypothetical protein